MDDNGTVGKSDFEIIFQNIAKAKNLKPSSSQYNQVHDKYMEDWEHLQKDTDKNQDGRVTLEEWLEHGDRRINDPSMYQTVLDIVD